MKKFLVLLLATVSSYLLTGQVPEILVDWGPVRHTNTLNFEYIIGASQNRFYTFGSGGKSGLLKFFDRPDYYISCFDAGTYQRIYTNIIEDFEYRDSHATFRRAEVNGAGEVLLYFDVYDRQADEKILIIRKLDKKGEAGKIVPVARIKADRRSEGGFVVQRSMDSSKILVYADPPYERRENESFVVKVLDRNFGLLWERSVVLPYSDKYFTLVDRAVTNSGKVFILGFAEPDRSKDEKREWGGPNQDYILFEITSEGEVRQADLDLDEKFVTEAMINTEMGDNKLAVAGFYSEENREGIGGCFYYTFGQDQLEPKSASLHHFKKDFLVNFMSEGRAERGLNLYNFKLKDVVLKSDGGAVVVAEQEYQVTSSMATGNVNSTSTTYYNNDIMVINIDPSGQISWVSNIPKSQASSDDGGPYSSYLLMAAKGKLYFVYNDHRKNQERLAAEQEIKGTGNLRKSVVAVSSIDKEGNVSYDQLFRNRDFHVVFMPKRSQRLNASSILIYGERGGRSRFGKLMFP